MSLTVFFLFLHVLAAILAFGTAILAFPFIGIFGERNPRHLNFTLRLNYALGRRAVTPLAIATFGFGLVLVFLGDWDLFGNAWLWISILMFLVTVADAQFVTLPTVRRLVEMTVDLPNEASEPSPEIAKLFRKVRLGGSVSATLLTIITLLMIWKPGS